MTEESKSACISEPLSQAELRQKWPEWRVAIRYRLLRLAALRAHRAWQEGAGLHSFDWSQASFGIQPDRVDLHLPPDVARTPLSQDRLLHILARWQRSFADLLRRPERLAFLAAFLKQEYTDRAGLRQVLDTLEVINSHHRCGLTRMVYRNLLRRTNNRAAVHGHWQPDPGLSPETLHEEITAAEDRADLIMKSDTSTRVLRAELLGCDAVIKRFTVSRPLDIWRYRFKPSKGRRAWIAAQVLSTLKIATPRPLGFLEYTDANGYRVSYYCCAYLPGAVSARQWIKPLLHRRPEDVREAVSTQLQKLLLELYRNGIYHHDTKTSNLLLVRAETPDREFLWIDLDGMRFGRRPGAYAVYRNLVQLNGSLGRGIPRGERVAFLDRLAAHYPWVNKPVVINQIERHTRIRLRRELNRVCGY